MVNSDRLARRHSCKSAIVVATSVVATSALHHALPRIRMQNRACLHCVVRAESGKVGHDIVSWKKQIVSEKGEKLAIAHGLKID